MRMIRDDLSNKLVHLVRGDSMEEAFHKFESILREGKLRGGTGYIKGGYRCVCFTETPISKLGYVLANPDVANMRYRPIGVMVDKKWVFERGGGLSSINLAVISRSFLRNFATATSA